eukprot:gene1696-1888_t
MPFIKKWLQSGRAFENEVMMNVSSYSLEAKRTNCILAPYSVARAIKSIKLQKLQHFNVNTDFDVMNHMIMISDVKTGKGTLGRKRKVSEIVVDEGGQFEDEREIGKRGVGSKQVVKEKERVRQQSRDKDKEQQEREEDLVKLNARENEKFKVSLKIAELDSQNKKKKKETFSFA